MEHQNIRTNQQRVKQRFGDPVVKRLARAERAHPDDPGHTTLVVEHDDVDAAFDDVKRFALAEVLVRTHVGGVRVHDHHLMQAVVDAVMSAQPDATALVRGRRLFQSGDVAGVDDDDRIGRIADLTAFRSGARNRAGGTVHANAISGRGRMKRPPPSL